MDNFDFRTWLKKQKGKDAVGYFSSWVFTSRSKRSETFPEGHQGKGAYDAWMKTVKVSGAIQACYEAAYQAYWNTLGRVENVDKKIKAPTVVFVKRHFKDVLSGEEWDDDEQRVIAVRSFVVEPAVVGRGMSLTVDLGQYESLKTNWSISIPCYREEIGVVKKIVDKWVSTSVNNDVRRLKKKSLLPEFKIPFMDAEVSEEDIKATLGDPTGEKDSLF